MKTKPVQDNKRFCHIPNHIREFFDVLALTIRKTSNFERVGQSQKIDPVLPFELRGTVE